jgi:hypothetical protein
MSSGCLGGIAPNPHLPGVAVMVIFEEIVARVVGGDSEAEAFRLPPSGQNLVHLQPSPLAGEAPGPFMDPITRVGLYQAGLPAASGLGQVLRRASGTFRFLNKTHCQRALPFPEDRKPIAIVTQVFYNGNNGFGVKIAMCSVHPVRGAVLLGPVDSDLGDIFPRLLVEV